MWNTLTLQRPKLKKKEVGSKPGPGLRRTKTFCDTVAVQGPGSQAPPPLCPKSTGDVKTNGSYKAWMNNIKQWRKKLLRNQVNFPDDNFSKSLDGSRESLDGVSCGPGLSEKVSRRAILDRSLNYSVQNLSESYEEDDIWYNSNKLFLDHINEIHGKWNAIEDDIWGKVIVMEKNRRVAKAYIRSPVITVGGGKEGFDGLRVGMQGFDNPFRSEETKAVMTRLAGQTCRIQMDSEGFVQVKRTGKTEVFVQSAVSVSRRWGDTLGRRRAHHLETDKSTILFDMEKLKRNIAESFMYGTSRNKKELELECVTTMSFVRNSENILEQPCWLIIINLVSLDFLRTSLAQQPVFTLRGCRVGEGRQRPRLSLPYEDGQNQQRRKKMEIGSSNTLTLKKNKGKKSGAGGDSLYYCGVQARISQFVLSEANRNRAAVQQSIRLQSERTESGGTEEESQSDTEYSQIYTDYYGCQPQSYPVKWR